MNQPSNSIVNASAQIVTIVVPDAPDPASEGAILTHGDQENASKHSHGMTIYQFKPPLGQEQ
jgi:hypothetical protein